MFLSRGEVEYEKKFKYEAFFCLFHHNCSFFFFNISQGFFFNFWPLVATQVIEETKSDGKNKKGEKNQRQEGGQY